MAVNGSRVRKLPLDYPSSLSGLPETGLRDCFVAKAEGHPARIFSGERIMLRRCAMVLSVASLVFSGVDLVAAATLYTVTDLGGGEAYGINANGQVVGQNAVGHAFFYNKGTITDLGTLGGSYSFALGINDSGRVVGWADNSGNVSQAFLYSGGTLSALGALGGGAQGISAAGQIVGWSNDPNGVPRACRYSDGAAIELGVFSTGSYSYALDINDTGQVVGYGDAGGEHAFLYENGAMTGLGVQSGAAQKINSRGQVAGGQYFSDTVWHAFLFTDGTAADLGTLGGPKSWAYGINTGRQIVGSADTATGVEHAFLNSNARMTDLNSLISSGWTLQQATAINDSGQIVGYGVNPSGNTDAFLLTPTPEPSTLVLLGVGAFALAACVWRRRRKLHNVSLMVLAAMFVLTAGMAQADVFNMGGTRDPATGTWTGSASLEFVTVGDPGNVADTAVMGDGSSGYGAVSYPYSIGKYDVTNAQYAQFLSAKATSSDPYGLWNGYMSSFAEGGINRSGSGPYTYTVKPGQGNQPVVAVTRYDTIRFVNWLTNGQQGGDTESGTYAISGSGPYWTVAVPSASQRATWAAAGQTHWLLPSEDEWYKAGYYDPTLNGGSGGYWLYPTRSNAPPTSQAPSGGTNSANFYDPITGFALTHSTSYNSSYNYLTDVGAYGSSLSACGTLDQGGDVWQWNEAGIFGDGSSRGERGGSWYYYSYNLASSYRNYNYSDPAYGDFDIGFRVASVPEPGSLAMLAGVALTALFCWWRKRA